MRRRNLFFLSFALVLFFVVTYAGASVVLYKAIADVNPLCGSIPANASNTPADFIPEARFADFDTTPYRMDSYELVTFPSREDNVALSGWYIPAEGDAANAPAVIITHGFDDCKRQDRVLTGAGMLHNNGFNVLVYDLREHGDSQIINGRTTAGLEEYRDVLGAWDWLQSAHGFTPEHIGLMGFSMGAATSTIALGYEPGLAAVWEDSGYTTLESLVTSEMRRAGMPLFFKSGGLFVGRLMDDFDINAVRPIDALAQLNGRPYYITQGAADTRVPIEQASELAAAANAGGTTVTPWIVLDANHYEAIFLVPDEYEANLVGFFSQALNAP